MGLPGFLVAVPLTILAGAAIARIHGGSEGQGFLGWASFNFKRFTARLRDHRIWMLGIGLGALTITGVLFTVVPQDSSLQGNGQFSRASVEMVPGTTLEQTEAVMAQAAAVLAKEPDVKSVFERVREGSGFLLITLNEDRDRTRADFERVLTPELQKIPDGAGQLQRRRPRTSRRLEPRDQRYVEPIPRRWRAPLPPWSSR